MNVIEVKGLNKKYRDFELKDIDLTLPSGCIMGLIGENGAGKSTTIKLILDMIEKGSGSIKIFDKENKKASNVIMEDIGVVFDDLCVPNDISPIKLNSVMKKIYKNWDENKYVEYLERFNVSKYKYIKELSRGNKMKVSIAVALSHNPKLLILDEPTSGLDPVVRDEIIDIFMEFTRDEQHSILISSHIVSDLEKACDYIAFLNNGRLIIHDEKDSLKEKYRIVKGSEEEINAIDKAKVIGKKENSYGVTAMVNKDAVPDGMHTENISIEDLFIYTVRKKEQNKKIEINYRKRRLKIAIMSILAIALVAVSVVALVKGIVKNRIDNGFKYGVHRTGYIDFTVGDRVYIDNIEDLYSDEMKAKDKEIRKFYKEVLDIKGVTAVGYNGIGIISSKYCKELDKLIEIQGNDNDMNNGDFYKGRYDFEASFMNKEAFNLYDIEIEKGKKPSELKQEDGITYIYLGSEYSDVKIGTEFKYNEKDYLNTTFKVAGILKKNSKIVETHIVRPEMVSRDPVYELDRRAIIIDEPTYFSTNTLCFSVEDNNEMDKIIDKIEEKAKKYEYEIETGKLDAEIDDVVDEVCRQGVMQYEGFIL